MDAEQEVYEAKDKQGVSHLAVVEKRPDPQEEFSMYCDDRMDDEPPEDVAPRHAQASIKYRELPEGVDVDSLADGFDDWENLGEDVGETDSLSVSNGQSIPDLIDDQWKEVVNPDSPGAKAWRRIWSSLE